MYWWWHPLESYTKSLKEEKMTVVMFLYHTIHLKILFRVIEKILFLPCFWYKMYKMAPVGT